MTEIASSFRKQIKRILSQFLLFTLIISSMSVVSGSNTWQPVDSPSWVKVEIPPGWNVMPGSATDQENIFTFKANSPDLNSDLFYILDNSSDHLTTDEMQAYQNEWMVDEGYRICRTKEPVIRTKSDHSEVMQVFVQGTDKGAVMYSADYPEHGHYHVALLMDGKNAVSEYYESIPPQIRDHIKFI